ncbi:hypothetical protein BJ742DRAFT_326392 [Cladochytrium replicatum]|nr:hypothetical protein BJ742DRAFT_326392 [Cladochytrium replicatum]
MQALDLFELLILQCFVKPMRSEPSHAISIPRVCSRASGRKSLLAQFQFSFSLLICFVSDYHPNFSSCSHLSRERFHCFQLLPGSFCCQLMRQNVLYKTIATLLQCSNISYAYKACPHCPQKHLGTKSSEGNDTLAFVLAIPSLFCIFKRRGPKSACAFRVHSSSSRRDAASARETSSRSRAIFSSNSTVYIRACRPVLGCLIMTIVNRSNMDSRAARCASASLSRSSAFSDALERKIHSSLRIPVRASRSNVSSSRLSALDRSRSRATDSTSAFRAARALSLLS